MRLDRLTIKSQELLQTAQSMAAGKGHQEIEPEHILAAMLDDEGGIVVQLIEKLGVSPATIRQEVGQAIDGIASVSGARPSPGTTAYGAAKAGLLSATKSLAMEWGPDIRVNALTPGGVFNGHDDEFVQAYSARAVLGMSLASAILAPGARIGPIPFRSRPMMACGGPDPSGKLSRA